MTKIDIVSGFLGAGKTTFIKKMLKEAFAGEQVVLIENEFGEIGIDGGFLKEAGIEIREMNSGCICCSLVGDFGQSLKEVVDTYHPDRILIEPSGVGKLSDVMKAVQDVEEKLEIQLNSCTTVVDVTKCKLYKKNFGEFFSNQIQYAETIILSRTDRANTEKIEEAVALLRELNEHAAIITTPITELSGNKILETMESRQTLAEELWEKHHHESHHHEEHESCGCGCDCGCEGHHEHHHHHHHHHAEEVFTSWGKETIHRYEKEEIADILKSLENEEKYGTILRAKGMVAGEDDTWIYFDMVPGEYDIRIDAAEYTGRICVIGSKLQEENLDILFDKKN